MPSADAKDLMRSLIADKYGGNPEWKDESERLFGPQEASAQWHEFEKDGIIPPPESDLTFVSVSANIPTQELAMFQADLLTRRGKSKFIVGDIADLGVHPFIEKFVKPKVSELHSFDYLRWNASELPLPDGIADIVIDRKGALWHVAYNFKDPRLLIDTFNGYHRILKPGGSLVVDNIKGFTTYVAGLSAARQADIVIKTLSGAPLSEIYPDAPMQYEPSTIYEIRRLALALPDNMKLITTISEYFDIKDFGEGALSVKIFTKK